MTDKTAEFRRINEPRVQRALEQIGHIEKSAKAMRVDPADLRALMVPLQTRLAPALGAAPAAPALATTYFPGPRQAVAERPAEAAPVVKAAPTRNDMALADLARTAPLRDLTMAMAVILNRIDDLIHEREV